MDGSRSGKSNLQERFPQKNASSASLKSSATDGKSLSHKPNRLQRFGNEFGWHDRLPRTRRTKLAHRVSPSRRSFYGTCHVAPWLGNGMSWLRRTRWAYSRFELDDIKLFTCSVADGRWRWHQVFLRWQYSLYFGPLTKSYWPYFFTHTV